MLDVILSYLCMWLPALCAVLGIVATVISCLSKVKHAVNELKSDNVIDTIEKENEEIHEEVAAVLRENAELMKQNRELKEKITGIRQKKV